MAREGVTYEEVSVICEKFKAEGIKPTQRNVRGELGTGSASTLLRHINVWKDNQFSTVMSDIGIPATLITAMKNAIADAVNKSTNQYEIELSDNKLQIEDNINLIARHEEEALALQQQSNDSIKQAKSRELELEKELSATKKEVEGLQNQNSLINEKLDNSIKAQELSRTESAKAQMQVERADKATIKAEDHANDLIKEVNKLKNELTLSEKQAATSSAISAEQTKAIKRLETELNSSQIRYDDLLSKHEKSIKSESTALAKLEILEKMKSL